jgi:hypothetical protein
VKTRVIIPEVLWISTQSLAQLYVCAAALLVALLRILRLWLLRGGGLRLCVTMAPMHIFVSGNNLLEYC